LPDQFAVFSCYAYAGDLLLLAALITNACNDVGYALGGREYLADDKSETG
jgi:hypothetical protein